MNMFLVFMFIFFIGCTCGWILELFYRRFNSGKWVNPGFMVGPYLPIYGFGLSALTAIYLIFRNLDVPAIVVILLMGASMTLIEFIGGLSFVDGRGPKLWDYSNEWGNYKGIICPLFSAIWTFIAALYYFFLANPILHALEWFSNNLAFSFILGMFFGIMIIDYIYSTNLYNKIKTYAKEQNIPIKLEEFKLYIKESQEKTKEKYHFLFSFNQNNSLKGGTTLKEFLDKYKKEVKKDEKSLFKMFKKKKSK